MSHPSPYKIAAAIPSAAAPAKPRAAPVFLGAKADEDEVAPLADEAAELASLLTLDAASLTLEAAEAPAAPADCVNEESPVPSVPAAEVAALNALVMPLAPCPPTDVIAPPTAVPAAPMPDVMSEKMS